LPELVDLTLTAAAVVGEVGVEVLLVGLDQGEEDLCAWPSAKQGCDVVVECPYGLPC
jgi:hypothetical protein